MPTPNTNVNLGVGNVDIIYAIQNLQATNTNSAIITSGSTASTIINLEKTTVTGFQMPSGWDGGNISFEGSDAEDGTFTTIYNSDGTQLGATVVTGSTIVSLVGYTLQGLANVPFVKVISASAVGANRTIKIMSKG